MTGWVYAALTCSYLSWSRDNFLFALKTTTAISATGQRVRSSVRLDWGVQACSFPVALVLLYIANCCYLGSKGHSSPLAWEQPQQCSC